MQRKQRRANREGKLQRRKGSKVARSPYVQVMRPERFNKMSVYSDNAQIPRPRMVPYGPLPGAQYSTRQLISAYSDSVGLTVSNRIVAGTTALFGAIGIELADIPQVAAFASVFDQYRIDRVEFFIKSLSNAMNSAIQTGAQVTLPELWVAIDRDDSTVVSTVNALKEYDNAVGCMAYQSIHSEFIPSVTPAFYQNSTFSGYGTAELVWIDCNSSSVPHYGIKFAVDPLSGTSTLNVEWYVDCYVHLSFKNTR